MEDPQDLRDRATDILSDPKYAPPEPTLLDRAWDRVVEFLDTILGPLFGASVGGFALGWILLAVVLGLIMFFVVRVMPGRRQAEAEEPARQVWTESSQRRSRKDWLDQATKAEAEGRFVEAVHARYRAMIAGLAERSELQDMESATSGEHRRAFDGGAERDERFANATETFEHTWYGGRAAGPEQITELGRDDEVVVGSGS